MLKQYGAVITFAICLILIVVTASCFAGEKLTGESIKIYPEQEQVCEFMSSMAYEIQLERRGQNLDKFPPSESQTMDNVAGWVYEHFSKQVTPDEVSAGMNSDCVGMFQAKNKNSLEI